MPEPDQMTKYLLGILFALLIVACNPKKSQSGIKMTNCIALEFVLENEATADSLKEFLKEIPMELYGWKNHLVLFGDLADTAGVGRVMAQSGLSVKTKQYIQPLYIYDKSSNCSDTSLQKPWKNYLLTANLVEDTILQKEYVAYHNTQFEEWPEVAEGFCNADFLQLLVYRNGRQLLLVISIPADKTLDELNPKTVENNPRMDEWNQIMANYQEGIEGTSAGEVWVFLEPVK